MLVGEFWSILGQRNLVYCQGFRREKILKSDPLNPAKGSGGALGVWLGTKMQPPTILVTIGVKNQHYLTSGPRPGKPLDPAVSLSCELFSILICRTCVHSISLQPIPIRFIVNLANRLRLRIANTIRSSEFRQPNTTSSLVPY